MADLLINNEENSKVLFRYCEQFRKQLRKTNNEKFIREKRKLAFEKLDQQISNIPNDIEKSNLNNKITFYVQILSESQEQIDFSRALECCQLIILEIKKNNDYYIGFLI